MCKSTAFFRIGLRTDEADQPNHTLEAFDVYFSSFQQKFIKPHHLHSLYSPNFAEEIKQAVGLLAGCRTACGITMPRFLSLTFNSLNCISC
ncbi:MAG: hypothetical protein Q8K35_01065 [Thiobacillus sp.]|nr:hypothetical protein [Thiobacillus sp.]